MINNQDPLLSEFPGAFMLKISMIAGNGYSWISSVCEKTTNKIVPTTTPLTLKTTSTGTTTTTITTTTKSTTATTTTTTLMTTTKGKHCELKSSPSDFNLYGCH
ncbi:unnamed protein product [Meloidogyne enterolobii]|uniref:Uncharacterized protein n=1 Tax=Meloidogyne enterolobii TaxID=390850 RepID=A0ACB0ZNB2_MELEN